MIPVLKVNNVTKKYGSSCAVKNISVEFNGGEIYGIVGANGAGKSTLLKMLCAQSRPTDGEIISNVECTKGVLIEKPGLFPSMTAKQNIKAKMMIRGICDDNRINDCLNEVGLGQYCDMKVAKYSLGMKQRLGIALALIGDPDVVILDEPLNGLDPKGIVEMRDLIIKLRSEHRIIIISSHLLSELSKVATKYIFINKGELKKIYSADEVEVAGISVEDIFLQMLGG